MALDHRKRRPSPARAGPNRAAHLADAAAQGQGPAAPPLSPEPAPAADTAADAAVKAAYAVVEQNIAEGRAAAQRLRAAAPPLAGPAPDAKAVAGRLMHMTKDLGATWIDLILTVLKEPDVRAVLDRLSFHDRPRAAAAAPQGVAVIQRISSRKPIEVTLSPLAATGATPPRIAGLHSLDAAQPSIVQVQFLARPDGGLELRIDIADDQPAGAYAGTVVDAVSLQPIGTLSVKVFA